MYINRGSDDEMASVDKNNDVDIHTTFVDFLLWFKAAKIIMNLLANGTFCIFSSGHGCS